MQIGLENFIDAKLAAYAQESRDFNAASAASSDTDSHPDPSTPDGLRQARAGLSVRAAAPGPPAVERFAEAAGRRVPVRILAPERGAARGVYLEIHGGGFYLGAAARGDARNRRLADALGVAVVSVDYRLAPEHPWPAAPDDCETAALWLRDEAEALFGATRLAIGGASAGATLAMTTLLRLRDRGVAKPFVGAALQAGTYDLSGLTPAGRRLADEFFIQAYAGHVADRTNPDVSPVYGDLRDLPPALLVVGSLDIMLEDNLALAARLSAAGGEVDVRVYPESPHGFTSFPTAMANAAVTDVESWLADRFDAT
ncbi:alpha/beta hydrolase [Capillimicrobium parvum]|uniref:Acetyl esterase n=1 Tax=Capillimicrobium parvum TaxID=2884022 RepID=A0A9E6Y0S2_9ACTN|nr:alpha/beta hydrolase [Capillimicrobium parvum]UGS38030.1 Acetyl esterase [Capillimicrobium parvum]